MEIFCRKIKQKIKNFLSGNLGFEKCSFLLHFFYQKSILFFGYSISWKKSNSDKVRKFYFFKSLLISKIRQMNRNTIKLDSFCCSPNALFKFVNFKLYNYFCSFSKTRLLNLFFSVESLSCLSQNYNFKSFLESTEFPLISNLNYNFGFLLLKLKILLRSYLLSSDIFFFKGFHFLKSLVFESDKKYFMLYRSLYGISNIKQFKLRNYFLGISYKFSNLLFVETSNFALLIQVFLKLDCKLKNVDLAVFLPFSLLLYAFRFCGFFHLWKYRSIGNINFIDFEDYIIINLFKFYGVFLYYWYSICNNKKSLRFFFKLLQQSCLLTLARKHKKNKTWTYDVFFSELFFYDERVFKDLIFYLRFFNVGNFLFDTILSEFKY